MFAQGNPLGKKPAPLSRLNCAMPAQESVVPSKRRLSLILMSIVLVTVVFCGCVVHVYIKALKALIISLNSY